MPTAIAIGLVILGAAPSQAGSEAAPAGDDRNFETVPFVGFSESDPRIVFEARVLDGQFRTVLKAEPDWILNTTVIPKKVMPLAKPGDFLIFGRDFPSGRPSLRLYSASDRRQIVCELPETDQDMLFRDAFELSKREGLLVLYATFSRRNWLWTFDFTRGGCPAFAKSWTEVRFRSKYQIDGRLFVAEAADEKRLYAGESYITIDQAIDEKLKPNPFSEALFSVSDTAGRGRPTLWFHEDLPNTGSAEGSDVSPIFVRRPDAAASDVYPADPLGLLMDSEHEAAAGEGLYALLTAYLQQRLHWFDGSGILSFGVNNEEGRVSWQQFYYLSAMLDVVEFAEFFSIFDRGDPTFRDKLKMRLDLEFAVFDRLICGSALEAYETKRYSLDRTPFHAAVNIGRLAELLVRYSVVTHQPMNSQCWTPLKRMLTTLEGTWDEFRAVQDPAAFNAPMGRNFLRRLRDVRFARDGNNLPFNHVSAWVSGLMWALRADAIDRADLPDAFIADSWMTFLELSAFIEDDGRPAKGWYYTWGPARRGWTAAENISTNAPSFKGTQVFASSGYLAMDMDALFATAFTAPELLPAELDDMRPSVNAAAAGGHLYPWLLAWRLRAGETIEITAPGSLTDYLFPTTASKFREAIWVAALYLHHVSIAQEALQFPATKRPLAPRPNERSRKVAAAEQIAIDDIVDFGQGKSPAAISVFDAHDGRGCWMLDAKCLPDRSWHIIDGSRLDGLQFLASPSGGETDELRIKVSNGLVWSTHAISKVTTRVPKSKHKR